MRLRLQYGQSRGRNSRPEKRRFTLAVSAATLHPRLPRLCARVGHLGVGAPGGFCDVYAASGFDLRAQRRGGGTTARTPTSKLQSQIDRLKSRVDTLNAQMNAARDLLAYVLTKLA
jgi:hypothetical protein